MNKPFLRAVAAALLTLALCGCASEYTQPTSTFPTLPSVPLEKTPLEQLTDALTAAFAQDTYTVTWSQVQSDSVSGGAERSQSGGGRTFPVRHRRSPHRLAGHL